MERETGFEPATSSVGSWHLTKQVRDPRSLSIWTLFGPYALGRPGPLWNGRSRRISNLGPSGPTQPARNQLEVLAGAISWGFKSPSPHHFKGRCSELIQRSLSFRAVFASAVIQLASFGFVTSFRNVPG